MLDEQVAELRVAGQVVELDRSSYDVLLALLRLAGEVATKDELLEAGWPDRVVSENSLAKAVSRLRQALGEDGAALKAVHGYGYRLALPVAFQPIPPEQVEAYPHQAERLREGDRLPHRTGWRLQHRLGEGGAGTTFLARSDAGELRAIKFATSENGLRSLKREIALTRYIRAVKPDLPDVAQAIDWQLAQAPYFLELPHFADGHLGDWAAARGGLAAIPLAERIAMCARLCDAVAGLHEIGVIHKDLKPENLYPQQDADGQWHVMLSDLGVGEAAPSPQLIELGITMTMSSADATSRAGSLLYVAPEIIAGEMPTQRSDVFSLGVLLYQLAVGDLRRSPAPGWEADVDDELLREDIALAAAANPELRQLDARGLAERLRTLESRHAERARQRAKLAADERQAEQLARMKQRRRWLAVVASALALGLLGTVLMYATAERSRRLAEDSARQRQAVLDFVTGDILTQADPYATRGNAGMSVREAVDNAASGVEARLSADPAAAAAVHAIIASVYFGQDRHAEAITHFQRARELYLRLGAEQLPALVRVETGLCDVYRIAADLVRAEEACQSALQRARGAGVDRDFALLKFGELRSEQNRSLEAQRILQPLLASPALQADVKAMGELYWTLGQCARDLGQFDAARRHFEKLLALYRKDGANSTWTGWAYHSLGSVLVETGDYARAEPLLANARRIFLQTQGPGVEAQMPNVWRVEARLRQGQWADAHELLLSQLQDWDKALKPGHPLRLKAEASLAWAEAGMGDTESARRALAAALANRATVFDRADDRIAARALRWTRVALVLGETDGARTLLDLFDQRAGAELSDPHPLRAEAACLRAQLDGKLGRLPAAHARAVRCRADLLRYYRPDHPLVREVDALLAASAISS